MVIKMNPKNNILLSRKFLTTIVASVVFVVLAVTETVEFSSSDAMVFILGIAGLSMSAHAATDISAIISGSKKNDE